MRFVIMTKTHSEVKKLFSNFLQVEPGWYALQDQAWGFKKSEQDSEDVVHLELGIMLLIEPVNHENVDSILKSFHFRLLVCG